MADLGYGENTEHMHLCHDCGKPLYRANWCDKKEDHRISGRCAECWKRIGVVWTIEYASGFDVSVQMAYHPEETSGYREDFIPYFVVGTGEHTCLPNINWKDLPERPSDATFLGCNNNAWILSEEEKERFIELNAERQKIIDEKEAKERVNAEQAKVENNKRKLTHEIVREYKIIQPRGGENGRDGYWDVEIKSQKTGVVTRVIVRNVFDFGYYGYPKRVEGLDTVFERNQWTEEEKAAVDWATKFSPLPHHKRM